MPCNSDHMEHSHREAESGRVLEFLKEIGGEPFDHDHPSYYGRLKTLDSDTAALCKWCESHDVAKASLELQLWWQRHQKHDAARKAEEEAKQSWKKLRDDALAKLTIEEALALGVSKR